MSMQPIGSAGVIPEWTMSDRLRKARQSSGLDQREFAERTGLAKNTISNYENGTTKPRAGNLKLWALATGVPLMWIETGCTPSDLNREPTDSGPNGGASLPRLPIALTLATAA